MVETNSTWSEQEPRFNICKVSALVAQYSSRYCRFRRRA